MVDKCKILKAVTQIQLCNEHSSHKQCDKYCYFSPYCFPSLQTSGELPILFVKQANVCLIVCTFILHPSQICTIVKMLLGSEVDGDFFGEITSNCHQNYSKLTFSLFKFDYSENLQTGFFKNLPPK